MTDFSLNQPKRNYVAQTKTPDLLMSPPPSLMCSSPSSDPHVYRRESASDIHDILNSNASAEYNGSSEFKYKKANM